MCIVSAAAGAFIIVLFLAGFIAQHSISLVDLQEQLVRLLVVWIQVWMILFGEFVVIGFDGSFIGSFIELQNVVKVSLLSRDGDMKRSLE